MPSVDFAPLTTPLPRDRVAAYKQHALQSGAIGAGHDAINIVRAVIAICIAVFAVLFSAGFLVLGLNLLRAGLDGFQFGSWLFVLVPAVILVGIVVGGIAAIRSAFGLGRWARWARLDRFAAVNGMRYSPQLAAAAEPGMIFGRGSERRHLDVFELGEGWLSSSVRIGNYRYVTGSGDDRTTHNWGCLTIQLDRHLPHMVLDATGNDSRFLGSRVSSLPSSMAPDQRVSLEGDFDKYFTLYAPSDYQRDALYVFTPDLMALLIDEVGSTGRGTPARRPAFDVEIVDDRMYIYSKAPLALTDPASWQRLLAIVTTVGSKTLRQTTRYSDERAVAPGIIAAPGRRLRTKKSWLFIAVALLFFAFSWFPDIFDGLISFIGGLFGGFFR